MSRHIKTFFLSVLLILVSVLIVPPSGSASSPIGERDSAKANALHDAMRKLWEDHITWTRVFIISAAGDLPDKATATDRLLQNQVDIGNAIKPYYGDAAGDKLTMLLKEHSERWQNARSRLGDLLSEPGQWPRLESLDQSARDGQRGGL